MLKIVKKYFEKKEWLFSQVKDNATFLFGIAGNNGNFQCIAATDEDKHTFGFLSVCGANTPVEKRGQMLELINRLNFSLFLGNFEMDFEDGEVRYRTGFFFESIEANEYVLDQLVMTNIAMMDKYLPALMGVMFGGLTALEALELAKKNKDQYEV
jgi:hypothetical protein